MPRPSIEISQDFIEDKIKLSAEAESLVLGEPEEALIKQIVDSAPSKMNLAQMAKWCNGKVAEILSAHPELQAKAELVRGSARKELMYHLSGDVFNQVEEIIATEKPKLITANWIYKKIPSARYKISQFRTPEGKVDWDFLTQKLGIKEIFQHQEQESWTFEKAVKTLNDNLKRDNPEKFGPSYIDENYRNLYEYFYANVKDSSGRGINWDLIIDALDDDLKTRWSRNNRYYEKEPQEHYEGGEVTADILETYQDQVYTMFQAQTPEEVDARNRIFKALISEAQKGNDSAKETALSYSKYIVEDWVHTSKLSRQVSSYPDLDQRITRMIYNYDPVKAPFVGFLFQSLKKLALGLGQNEVSLEGRDVSHTNGKWKIEKNKSDYSNGK